MVVKPKLEERNYHDVADCVRALSHGTKNLSSLPGLLKILLVRKSWMRYRDEQSGKEFIYTDVEFPIFVESKWPSGLGSSETQLLKLVHGHVDVEKLIVEHYEKARPRGINQHHDNIMTLPASQGTSRQYALRKLRKERPDLLTQVIAGDKTPHAAMVEAGFRKRPNTLEQLKKLWMKATLDERLSFTVWLDEQ